MTACTFDGCPQAPYQRALCRGHYEQLWKGKPLTPLIRRRRKGEDLESYFWSCVDKTQTCWIWTRAHNAPGYGRIQVDGRLKYAHRVAWELARGVIPEGMELDHLCHTPRCVNPSHLRIVTHAENQQNRSRGGYRNNSTGYRGVSYDKEREVWKAQVRTNGRNLLIGRYETPEAAAEAAADARSTLLTHTTN